MILPWKASIKTCTHTHTHTHSGVGDGERAAGKRRCFGSTLINHSAFCSANSSMLAKLFQLQMFELFQQKQKIIFQQNKSWRKPLSLPPFLPFISSVIIFPQKVKRDYYMGAHHQGRNYLILVRC